MREMKCSERSQWTTGVTSIPQNGDSSLWISFPTMQYYFVPTFCTTSCHTDFFMHTVFILIKIFIDFCNIVLSRGDRWKKGIWFFKRISRRFVAIVLWRALFGTETYKELSLLIKFFYMTVIVSTVIFLLSKNVFNIDQYLFRLTVKFIKLFEIWEKKNCFFDVSVVAVRRFWM